MYKRQGQDRPGGDIPADVTAAEEKVEAGQTNGESSQEEKPGDIRPSFAVFSFPNLRRVCNYAAVLPRNLRIKSTLFQMGETYYLFLDKGAASYERYSRACIQAMEFGDIYTAEKDMVMYLEEHGECIVREHAVRKLRLEESR